MTVIRAIECKPGGKVDVEAWLEAMNLTAVQKIMVLQLIQDLLAEIKTNGPNYDHSSPDS